MTAPHTPQGKGGKLCPGACKVGVVRVVVKTLDLAHWIGSQSEVIVPYIRLKVIGGWTLIPSHLVFSWNESDRNFEMAIRCRRNFLPTVDNYL